MSTRPKVIRKKSPAGLEDSIKFELLWKYSRGIDEKTIASEYGLDEFLTITWLQDFAKSLVTVYETKALTIPQEKHRRNIIKKVTDPRYINEGFLKKISGPEETLTDAEQLYCFLYVENGCNNEVALEGSGLDEGLPRTAISYQNMVHLRGQYLREKPNVKQEIRELRETQVTDERTTKQALQMELLDFIASHKVKNNVPSQVLKAIELLMRSENHLTQNVNVTSVDPADEMKKLVEMVKKDEVYVKSGNT